jgi:hypothetical protein
MCRGEIFIIFNANSIISSKCFENFIFPLTSIELWKCISDKNCDINTPIFQLYNFLFVYKRGFNAYAIFIAKDRWKKVDQKNYRWKWYTSFYVVKFYFTQMLWMNIKNVYKAKNVSNSLIFRPSTAKTKILAIIYLKMKAQLIGSVNCYEKPWRTFKALSWNFKHFASFLDMHFNYRQDIG